MEAALAEASAFSASLRSLLLGSSHSGYTDQSAAPPVDEACSDSAFSSTAPQRGTNVTTQADGVMLGGETTSWVATMPSLLE